ncbi:MAG: trigger factor [Chitinophagales bacterium]
MTITAEKTGDLKSIVRINLKKEDFEPKVTAAIKKLAKQVAIKGFRPGQVPMPVVKKMYGNSVLAEELNRELNEQMWNYLQENKLDILGQPIPAADQPLLDMDINAMKDVDFAYELGMAPEVDLSLLSQLPAFTRYKIEVTDAMINDEIERLRKRHSTYEYPEDVKHDDVLSLTIEELDADGNVKEGGVSTVSSVMADMVKEKYRNDLLSMKKHESINRDIWEFFDRDREAIVKHLLNLNDMAKAEQLGNQFRLTLNNITRAIPAELNEEFFTKAFGENGVNNETAMRENMTSELEAYLDGRSDALLMNDIYKGVLDAATFALPDDFLKRWVKVSNEKPISDEQIEEDYPRFSKQLRWQLITNKIAADQKYEVTAEELKDRTKMQLLSQLYQYGMRNMADEWLDNFIEKQMADKEHVRRLNEEIMTDKVIAYIKSQVKLKDTPIDFERFKVLVEGKNAEG